MVELDKIQAVQSHPIPTTVQKLKELLGLIGYYRCFVANYAPTQECFYLDFTGHLSV